MAADDARLVELARGGDREAFAQLVRRHLRSAYAVALAVLGVPEDAEDASQDAIVSALQQLERCRDPARFGAWLVGITRNRARDMVRRRTVRVALPLEAAAHAAGGASPLEDAERSEMRTALLAGLATLTEVQREVVLLHDMEAWPHRDIAAALRMPEGTVRAHLFHARRALRACLTREMPEETDARRAR